MWTVKEPPMSYYKYDTQSVLKNATYNMYYDRSIITDRTVHNNKPDTNYFTQPPQQHTQHK
jgi:hypothetical protein